MSNPDREEWLLYGEPADHIDRPNMVFARRHDEFVLMPVELFERDAVERAEHVPGEIYLDDIAADEGYHDIVDALEPVDVDELVAETVGETVWSEQEARVAILYGWFDLSQDEIARLLDLSKHTVRNHLQAARDRFDRAKTTVEYTIPRVTSRAE